jgi:DNA-binding NtrC family response regulator
MPQACNSPVPMAARLPARATVKIGRGALPTILFVSCLREDRAELRRALEGAYHVLFANTCHEALNVLQKCNVPVVLCETKLPDGSWLDLLNGVASSPHLPLLIVTSRLADDRLWAEVLNLGGFDLIAKPFCESEVRHVVDTAWYRKNDPARPLHNAAGCFAEAR